MRGRSISRTLSGARLKKTRQRIQMVFQDPFSSLSPRMTVSTILREPLEVHGVGNENRGPRWSAS